MTTTHFYTLDATEAQAAVINMQATVEQASAFWALAYSPSPRVPMYRLANAARGTFFLTTFIDEHDAAVNEEGYKGTGISFWCFPADSTETAGTQPLYRVFNSAIGDYLYTLDPHELPKGYARQGTACLVLSSETANATALLRFRTPSGHHLYSVAPVSGNTYEGTCGYVFADDGGAPEPLYRAYNPVTGGHLYTANIVEYDNAASKSGYRGDGIACFLLKDGLQQAGMVRLLRAYNHLLDDHFYTIDATEHQNAVANLKYTDEGFSGWVWAAKPAGRSTRVRPVQRLIGSFANDFLLLPPGLPEFLSSGSNFILASNIGAGTGAIVGLDVELAVSADFVVDSVNFGTAGLSLQLNAWSPALYTSSWQQYTISLFDGVIQCEIQNWSDSSYNTLGFIVDAKHLCNSPGNKLPSGYRLRIALHNDTYANITGADFYVHNGTHQVAHQRLTIKDFKDSFLIGIAPIVAFHVVLVGPFDDETVTIAAGGAGLITYKSAVPLCANSQLPSAVESPDKGTGEQSNCFYGPMAETKSKVLTQVIGVNTMPT